MGNIDISNLDKAKVLSALYNNAKSLFGGTISFSRAQKLLDSGQTYFDYLEGKVMKIDIAGDEIDPRLYDRDNGEGVAKQAIDSISSN